MTLAPRPSRLLALAAAVLALAACSGGDPLAQPPGDASGTARPIVVGSQDYYSNEIVAEIYAQVLEADGYTVDRQFRIGQREAYLPEIEAGRIDLFPEYTGPLLQYWKPDASARAADDVDTALQAATPQGLRVLAPSPATDQDSYAVTRAFADRWGLSTVADLAKVGVPMTLGANSEAEARPNGPRGLKDTYGVEVAFTPIEDGGGPLTVKALKDDTIQIAIVYTADPSVASNDLVVLEDTGGLFLASHLVPLAGNGLDERAAAVVEAVAAQMTTQDLLALNARSVEEQLPAATIASDWLTRPAGARSTTPAS